MSMELVLKLNREALCKCELLELMDLCIETSNFVYALLMLEC